MLVCSLLLLSLIALEGVAGSEGVLRIHSTSDMVELSEEANNGTDYSETTVLLDADIDFSGVEFEPIGKDLKNYFNGTFDGQGHAISNLKVNSSSPYVGLFGYSAGLTIRNLVLDESCSIVNSANSRESHVGGIIGYCDSITGPCVVENSVSKASVSFVGAISGKAYIGGIAGLYISSITTNQSSISNCANYGLVIHNGESGDSYIGGIAGATYGFLIYFNQVQITSCTNYGTVFHNGTVADSVYIHPIVGTFDLAIIEDCKNKGKIKTSGAGSLSVSLVLLFCVLLFA